jgi:hypothetical protein
MSLLPRLTPLITFAGILFGCGAAPLFASENAPASLLQNHDFEVDADNDGWPDQWPKAPAGLSWENEDGNRFLRCAPG